jgi:hypothetical protein
MNLADMTTAEIVITVLQWGIPLILAITLHEAGHAYAAKKLGDHPWVRNNKFQVTCYTWSKR